MSKAEIMVIMILFHDSGYRCLKHFYIEKVCRHMRHLFPKVVSYNRFVELEKEVAIPLTLFIKKLLLRKRAIIETVNDELKNIAQVEHSRHRCFDNFIVNLLGAIAAYCMFPKKPCINVQRTVDTQLSLF